MLIPVRAQVARSAGAGISPRRVVAAAWRGWRRGSDDDSRTAAPGSAARLTRLAQVRRPRAAPPPRCAAPRPASPGFSRPGTWQRLGPTPPHLSCFPALALSRHDRTGKTRRRHATAKSSVNKKTLQGAKFGLGAVAASRRRGAQRHGSGGGGTLPRSRHPLLSGILTLAPEKSTRLTRRLWAGNRGAV